MKLNCLKTFIIMFLASFVFCFNSQDAEAKTYKMFAYALDKVSTTEKMPRYLTLKVPAQVIGGDIEIQNEALIRVQVLDISSPKRGKRDGYLTVKLIAYTVPNLENKVVDVSQRDIVLKVKRYSERDYKGLAKTAATTVVSHVAGIPFLNQGVAVVKGAVKPKEGKSRVKSAGISLYESTPLSYFNKGENLNVAIGEKLTLTFKTVEQEDDPNYEYTPQE